MNSFCRLDYLIALSPAQALGASIAPLGGWMMQLRRQSMSVMRDSDAIA
jgi:hypothetical protein